MAHEIQMLILARRPCLCCLVRSLYISINVLSTVNITPRKGQNIISYYRRTWIMISTIDSWLKETMLKTDWRIVLVFSMSPALVCLELSCSVTSGHKPTTCIHTGNIRHVRGILKIGSLPVLSHRSVLLSVFVYENESLMCHQSKPKNFFYLI